jgi:transcriptional regulator with XRE-family HTH domain
MARRAAKESVNHLRAWREFRRLSQQQLGEAVGTAGNVIGALESGERGLSDKWLRKLAPALGTTPGFLLDYHPEDIDGELLNAVRDLPEERRKDALTMLRVLTGTHG